MHPIFVDVFADIAEVGREGALLEQARQRCATLIAGQHDAVDLYIHVGAVASGVEKVFSGIEKALARIARDIDGHVPDDPAWHATLLRRMASDVPDRRPVAISTDTRKLLDRLRSFRHRERNTYGSDLLPGIVLDHAATIPVTIEAVTNDLRKLEAMLSRPLPT